jgi:transposase
MAKLARAEMAVDKLTAVADRGYYKSEEILACHEAGISVFVPKTVTSSATAHGRFGKDDFIYNAQTNEYRCPAGERLIWRFSTVERGLKISKYWSSNCQQCPLKGDCTPGPQRRVARWEHEAVLDEMQARLDHAPEMMRIRRQTVEHPFGTIKAWMGATRFQTTRGCFCFGYSGTRYRVAAPKLWATVWRGERYRSILTISSGFSRSR